MALDLFHARCGELGVPCRRTHFHEFILDVHVQYHKLRQANGSRDQLVQQVADGNALRASYEKITFGSTQ